MFVIIDLHSSHHYAVRAEPGWFVLWVIFFSFPWKKPSIQIQRFPTNKMLDHISDLINFLKLRQQLERLYFSSFIRCTGKTLRNTNKLTWSIYGKTNQWKALIKFLMKCSWNKDEIILESDVYVSLYPLFHLFPPTHTHSHTHTPDHWPNE